MVVTEPDADAWTETTSGRERVRAVVETLDEPATVTEIADRANVAWATADSELDRLLADNRVRRRDVDGESRYEPNPVRQFLDEIVDLIETHGRDELEAQLVDYQSRLESLRGEYDAEAASDLRGRLTDGDRSAAEMRELRNVAATWEALETERRLVTHALDLYEDVARFADSDGESVTA